MLDWMMGKKARFSFSLSPTSVARLDAIAQQRQVARADVIEQLLQGQLTLIGLADSPRFRLPPAGGTVAVESSPESSPESSLETSPETGQAASPVQTGTQPEADPKAEPTPTAAAAPVKPAIKPAGVAAAFPAAESAAKQLVELPLAVTPDLPAVSAEQLLLQQQVSDLQAALFQQHQLQAVRTREHRALAEIAAQQQQRIEALEAQLVQLSPMAAIGESRVNRWRFQHYSR